MFGSKAKAMELWEEGLVKKCRKAGLKLDLYRRYVDDQFLVMRAVAKGWSYDQKTGRMVFSREKADCDTTSDTERTAKVMADIANSIHEQIQVTTDIPGQHPDGRMPVLDLKVWVNLQGEIPKVSHTFYKKPVAPQNKKSPKIKK